MPKVPNAVPVAESAAAVVAPAEAAPAPVRRAKVRKPAAEPSAAIAGTRRRKPAAEAAGADESAPSTAAPSPKAIRERPAETGPAGRVALVRDSFTIPADEYATLVSLKRRLVQMGHETRKTEVVRAGLLALAGLDDAALLAAVQTVPRLATGRPKAKGKAKGKARGG